MASMTFSRALSLIATTPPAFTAIYIYIYIICKHTRMHTMYSTYPNKVYMRTAQTTWLCVRMSACAWQKKANRMFTTHVICAKQIYTLFKLYQSQVTIHMHAFTIIECKHCMRLSTMHGTCTRLSMHAHRPAYPRATSLSQPPSSWPSS